MFYGILVTTVLCILLLSSSIFLLIENLRLKKDIKLKRYQERPLDCTELLEDILAGQALVRVERISPVDVFLRRR